MRLSRTFLTRDFGGGGTNSENLGGGREKRPQCIDPHARCISSPLWSWATTYTNRITISVYHGTSAVAVYDFMAADS